MKKAILIIGSLVVVGGIVLYMIPWGTVESDIQKTELSVQSNSSDSTSTEGEKVVKGNLNDVPVGKYSASTENKDNMEVLFYVEGLKKTTGKFESFQVDFSINEERLNSELKVVIQAASIFTNNTMRDEHLNGDEFFNTTKYPTIEFSSQSITETDTNYMANGNLFFLGQTKPMELPFKYMGQGQNESQETIYAFEGSFQFNRIDYGMEPDNSVGDVVDVNFYVELK